MKNNQGMTQFYKYSLIGLSCALIDIGVLNTLLFAFPTQDAGWLTTFNTVAYTAAILNSYVWNSRYTFNVQKNKKQFVGFILQATASLFIANGVFIGGIWIMDALAILPDWAETNTAKGLSMLLSSLSSFFFMKWFVFRR
ncbi:GtrA family protein [Jeotgalibacillus sp. R-1-5s-1]|uniref:GtrA family protein n=1 Tax=Jeotgalibacillus sp. R-1-5s-1 TaxID=2555897 RepID=UPI00106C0050|nr:GtrA family protein [Jeotgalibacillus sp. R-1-5s-1]TFD99976.1 GtrA family protein [Jeotgalibacillus sp. R-1-5s-1]